VNLVEWTTGDRDGFLRARAAWGDPLAYEQSWLYLCQALRRGGWTVSNAEGWAAIARDYVRPGVHAMVVPMGKRTAEFISSAILLLSANGIVVGLIKHVPKDLLDDLLNSSEILFRKSGASDSEESLEDISEDQFPQVLVPVGEGRWSPKVSDNPDALALPSGRESQDFRYQVRRFLRSQERTNSAIDIRSLRTTTDFETSHAIERWLESVRRRYSGADRPKVNSFVSTFREPVVAIIRAARNWNSSIVGEVLGVNGRYSALWAGEKVSDTCFGIYVLIADTNVKNLSDYTLLRALLGARSVGAKYVNLGGSELSSLFRFKAKSVSRTGDEDLCFRRVIDVKVYFQA